MEKWADYGISGVRYNQPHTHIVRVNVHTDKGNSLGSPVEWTRDQLIAVMHLGKTLVTILHGAENKWQRGQEVHGVSINGARYIRTDRDPRALDNLENLPEF